ncbi:substrate-binding domain-containing protein [Mesorhizobium kowhaii]|nr:substrate-binding domain-containing protein [Mesorhizobium kowhaii]
MKRGFIASAAIAVPMIAALGSAVMAAGTEPSVISEAKAYVEKVSAMPGAWPGPKTSPTVAKGKSVTIISCAQASNCSVDAQSAYEAALELGWTPTIVDGKGDPSLYNAALRSATNAKADGIIDISLPSALIQDGLRYATQHKIPVINAADIISKDPLIFGSVEHQWTDQGVMLGKWIIADSDGKAGVIILRDDEFPGVKERQDNVSKVLATCGGCKVLDEVGLTIQQATNPSVMQQQVQSLLARFGKDATYIVAPFGTVDGLVVPALRAAGRSEVKVVGYDGNKQQMQLCQQGKVNAIAVTMLAWTGWGAVDQLNRAFNGEKAAPQAVPAFLMTKQTCTGSGMAEDVSTFDYKAEYRKLWGIAK